VYRYTISIRAHRFRCYGNLWRVSIPRDMVDAGSRFLNDYIFSSSRNSYLSRRTRRGVSSCTWLCVCCALVNTIDTRPSVIFTHFTYIRKYIYISINTCVQVPSKNSTRIKESFEEKKKKRERKKKQLNK